MNIIQFLRGLLFCRPLVYICTKHGVTGVVSKTDYDLAIKYIREKFRENLWPEKPICPQVYPVFMFSDDRRKSSDIITGRLRDLKRVLIHFRVERRDFELPFANGEHTAPDGYYGFKYTTSEPYSRFKKYTLDEMLTILSD